MFKNIVLLLCVVLFMLTKSFVTFLYRDTKNSGPFSRKNLNYKIKSNQNNSNGNYLGLSFCESKITSIQLETYRRVFKRFF